MKPLNVTKVKRSTLHYTSVAWDKVKHLSARQESNPRPPEHRARALSTELRELMESKVI